MLKLSMRPREMNWSVSRGTRRRIKIQRITDVATSWNEVVVSAPASPKCTLYCSFPVGWSPVSAVLASAMLRRRSQGSFHEDTCLTDTDTPKGGGKWVSNTGTADFLCPGDGESALYLDIHLGVAHLISTQIADRKHLARHQTIGSSRTYSHASQPDPLNLYPTSREPTILGLSPTERLGKHASLVAGRTL